MHHPAVWCTSLVMSCLLSLCELTHSSTYVTSLVQRTSKQGLNLVLNTLGVDRQEQAFDRGTNTWWAPAVVEEFTIVTPGQGLACRHQHTVGPPDLQAFQM